MRCEANGCERSISAGRMLDQEKKPTPWTRWKIPCGWSVGWVSNDGSASVKPHGRLVVLCPMHGVGTDVHDHGALS